MKSKRKASVTAKQKRMSDYQFAEPSCDVRDSASMLLCAINELVEGGLDWDGKDARSLGKLILSLGCGNQDNDCLTVGLIAVLMDRFHKKMVTANQAADKISEMSTQIQREKEALSHELYCEHVRRQEMQNAHGENLAKLQAIKSEYVSLSHKYRQLLKLSGANSKRQKPKLKKLKPRNRLQVTPFSSNQTNQIPTWML